MTLLGAVFIIGCAGYQPAPLAPERSAEQFASRRLSDAPVREGVARLLPENLTAWPPQAWDRAQLLAVALVQSPRLAVAAATMRASLAHETSAAQAANPQLILESEYASHDQHPWLYGVGLDWLLRSSERRRLDIESARLETRNARLQSMDQIWQVRQALIASLSEIESTDRSQSLLARLAAAQDRLIAVERQRVARGEDAPAELLTLQALRMGVEQQQAEERAKGVEARAALANALGLPPQALDGVAYRWPEWGAPPAAPESDLQGARERALLSRTDLAVAIGEYAVTETKLKLAIARQYPQFELEPGYYWDHGIAKWPLDVGFTLPFNRNRGEIAEARAARDQAGQHMLAQQAGIYGEIAAAERAEGSFREAVEVAERRLQAARQQLQQVELGLRLGASDQHAQLDAEILVARAELELLELRARLQASRNALEDALHAPLSGPELSLSTLSVPNAPGTGS